jgi:hypothetical protein
VSESSEGYLRLEQELKVSRRWGRRAVKDMHAVMLKDLRAAEGRARRAERRTAEARKRAKRAEQRAVRAERELAELRQSATWRAGRALLAVPSRLKRR